MQELIAELPKIAVTLENLALILRGLGTDPVMRGHFRLKHGCHCAAIWRMDAVLMHQIVLDWIMRALAPKIVGHQLKCVVAAPCAALLANSLARALMEQDPTRNVRTIILSELRPELQEDLEGKRCAVIDTVVTESDGIKDVIGNVRAFRGIAEVAIIFLNRGLRPNHPVTAQDLDVPQLLSFLTRSDLLRVYGEVFRTFPYPCVLCEHEEMIDSRSAILYT